MSGDLMIDGALFLGMHHTDDAIRRGCKAFFAGHLHTRVTMSLEQVGLCDDRVWGFPREIQDAYYPFMDVLHSDMAIARVPYTREDLDLVVDLDLPLTQGLTVAMARRRDAVLITADPLLLGRPGLPVRGVDVPDVEAEFPPYLEKLYADSLVLRTGL